MVVEEVDEDAAIKAIARRQAQAAALEVGVALGKGIDLAVQEQPLANAGRIGLIERTFDKIPHEVAYQQLRIVAGEIKVEEDIHALLLTSRAPP